MARKQRGRARLYTRNGHDWASRYPTIVKAVLALKGESLLLDGEAVICNKKGVADFDQPWFKILPSSDKIGVTEVDDELDRIS